MISVFLRFFYIAENGDIEGMPAFKNIHKNSPTFFFLDINVYICKRLRNKGVLHTCDAEIIPIEPDADNAAEGMFQLKNTFLFEQTTLKKLVPNRC